MIYTIVDNKIVPYKSRSGRKFNPRSKDQKRHDTKQMKKKNKFYNFYNSARWKQLSLKIRTKRDPLCKRCVRLYRAGKIPLEKVNYSQSVDHIVKLSDDWSRRWDPSNLQGLCNRCHREKDKAGFLNRS